jgi:polynucleotide 5'-kinase involved in rRNA processing
MVCGLKGTGKSTFCRLLANSMLSARANSTKESYGFAERDYSGSNGVAFLDLDPGQPEFSPPGEVTLTHMRQFNLGVPYTHPMVGTTKPNRLARAHHIGAVSANVNPEHYRKCALDLFRHYKFLLLQDPSCPLIVNCSGWVTASGLEVLVALIQQMALTDIVYTTKGGPPEVSRTLGDVADKAGVAFHPLESQQPTTLTRSAADLRMMQALSYFHLDEPEGIHPRWSRSPLNEVAPTMVRYCGPSQDIFALMILGEEQDPDLYGSIFEGSIVGVVALEDDSAIPGVRNEGRLDRIAASPEDDVEMNEIHHDEQNASRQLKLPHAQDLDLSTIDDFDDACISESRSDPSSRHPPSKTPRNHPTKPVNADVKHPLVSRTPEGLPYLYTGTGVGMQAPLDPSKCHSLGQALIRGIDAASQTIHLLTPIPTSTLQSLGRHQTKIVLVRGALDMPTWAYMEAYVAMANRRRPGGLRREGNREKSGAWAMKEWAEGTPWAEFTEGKGEKGSAKVRHSRRNLRTGWTPDEEDGVGLRGGSLIAIMIPRFAHALHCWDDSPDLLHDMIQSMNSSPDLLHDMIQSMNSSPDLLHDMIQSTNLSDEEEKNARIRWCRFPCGIHRLDVRLDVLSIARRDHLAAQGTCTPSRRTGWVISQIISTRSVRFGHGGTSSLAFVVVDPSIYGISWISILPASALQSHTSIVMSASKVLRRSGGWNYPSDPKNQGGGSCSDRFFESSALHKYVCTVHTPYVSYRWWNGVVFPQIDSGLIVDNSLHLDWFPPILPHRTT